MKKILILIVLLSSVILLSSFMSYQPSGGNYVVIVNKDNPIASMTPGEANIYFLRKLKSRWPGLNKNIRIATRKGKCPERDAFYGQILKMSDTEVDNYFAERQYQNAEKLPDKFGSDNEIISFVDQEVGAIAFVNSKSLTDEAKGKVKVVLEF